jgi:DNA-binding MarR family transcriptional regulator
MPEPLTPLHAPHASLSRHTGYLISRLGVLAQKRFAQRLATIGLTTRMWGLLNVLETEEPITQQRLGQLIGMDPSSMVATVDELERQGLVQRRPHPRDRRAHALYITADGRTTLLRGRKLAKEAQDELLAPLDDADRRQLHELLLRVVPAIDAVDRAAADGARSRSPERPETF